MKIRGILVGLASVVLLTLTVCAAEKVKLDGIKCAMNPKNAAKDDAPGPPFMYMTTGSSDGLFRDSDNT